MSAAPVSVLILTRNEETVIARAIRSVGFADEVVVVDSESSDDTRRIASALGAKVVVQPWLGWLPQKAVGLSNCSNEWVFSLDADEVVTAPLAASIRRAMAGNPNPRDAYALERQEEFLGKLMPSMRRRSKRLSFIRLFNKRYSNWDPELIIHEEIRCPGTIRPLDGDLLHWRNYTIADQLDTLNRNADLEAEMILRSGRFRTLTLLAKPPLRFLWIYLACGNWRMGMRGFIWAGLHAFAEFLRYAKAWERLRTQPVPHPPEASFGASGRPQGPARRAPATIEGGR